MSDSVSCPFCRSLNNSVVNFGTDREKQFHVNCHDCGADGPMASSRAEAERLWKTRPPEKKRGNGNPPRQN